MCAQPAQPADTIPATQIVCDEVSFSYTATPVLDGINLTIADGDVLALVGPNGCGKSTLLSLLAGSLEPTAGRVDRLPPDSSVGLLRQILDDRPDENVGTYLARSTGIAAIERELEEAAAALVDPTPTATDRYDRALRTYETSGSATYEHRRSETFDQLGLSGVSFDQTVAHLSGGQRSRVGLAAMLLAQHQILLLDEPTNDLDWEGLDLLETMLKQRAGPVAIVSHDRRFLETVSTAVFEFHDHHPTGSLFNGGFEAWQNQRELARQQATEDFARYTATRSALESRSQQQREWSDQGRSKVKKDTSEKDKNIKNFRRESSEHVAAKAAMTQQAIDRLDAVEKPWEPWELRLRFGEGQRSGVDVAELIGAVARRGDFRLGPVSVKIGAGDRILITGPNGSGKSSLLAALLGELTLVSGDRRMGRSVVVGRLDQRRSLLRSDESVLETYCRRTGSDEVDARSQLAKLGIDQSKVVRMPSELSPGEQTRVILAIFAAVGTNLLVLDEPTNHLDLSAVEQLEVALSAFPHTVILVTHDRALIDGFDPTHTWTVSDGLVRTDEKKGGPSESMPR